MQPDAVASTRRDGAPVHYTAAHLELFSGFRLHGRLPRTANTTQHRAQQEQSQSRYCWICSQRILALQPRRMLLQDQCICNPTCALTHLHTQVVAKNDCLWLQGAGALSDSAGDTARGSVLTCVPCRLGFAASILGVPGSTPRQRSACFTGLRSSANFVNLASGHCQPITSTRDGQY